MKKLTFISVLLLLSSIIYAQKPLSSYLGKCSKEVLTDFNVDHHDIHIDSVGKDVIIHTHDNNSYLQPYFFLNKDQVIDIVLLPNSKGGFERFKKRITKDCNKVVGNVYFFDDFVIIREDLEMSFTIQRDNK